MDMPLQGDCTIETAAALHQQLKEALHRRQPLTLSFAGLNYADLSFFQLIQAAIRSFEKHHVTLTLRPDLPSHLGQKAYLCGLPQLVAKSQVG